MSKVKMGFSGLSVPVQVERARNIVVSLTGNAAFPTPNPTLVVVGAAVDALELAYNESRNRDKTKVAAMNLRRKELLFLVSQLAAYVQQASDGDEEKILSSGFDVVKKPSPHPEVAGPVKDVDVLDGSNKGSIKPTWSAADDAVIYVVEVSPNIEFKDGDKIIAFTTRTQKEVEGLETGMKVWVRITPLGREKSGPTSEPVSIIVR